ncbi:MAG: hypothetical protein IRY94_20510, partial [Rhodospirillaceae bacterium]|nr:hypothetical protein [Rhodospirillaceae bacterium]
MAGQRNRTDVTEREAPPAGESAGDRFRRVTAATVRAIARRPEAGVVFAPTHHGLHGTEVRLPPPPRDMPAHEVA